MKEDCNALCGYVYISTRVPFFNASFLKASFRKAATLKAALEKESPQNDREEFLEMRTSGKSRVSAQGAVG
ncbi:MAG: hypothetical protein ACLQBC_18385 [Syntrophales bacterium]